MKGKSIWGARIHEMAGGSHHTLWRSHAPVIHLYFFLTHFMPLTVISDDLRVFPMFLWSYHKKITHCGRNKIDHGHPCRTEFTIMSLYSIEITCHRLWFLEYELTQVNSVPHGRPWWILYVFRDATRSNGTSSVSDRWDKTSALVQAL